MAGDFFETHCGESGLEPINVDNLPPVIREPVGKFEYRQDVLDVLEVVDEEVESVRHAPDVVNGQCHIATFALDLAL